MDQFLQVLILLDLKPCLPIFLTVVLNSTKTTLDNKACVWSMTLITTCFDVMIWIYSGQHLFDRCRRCCFKSEENRLHGGKLPMSLSQRFGNHLITSVFFWKSHSNKSLVTNIYYQDKYIFN